MTQFPSLFKTVVITLHYIAHYCGWFRLLTHYILYSLKTQQSVRQWRSLPTEASNDVLVVKKETITLTFVSLKEDLAH